MDGHARFFKVCRKYLLARPILREVWGSQQAQQLGFQPERWEFAFRHPPMLS